MSVGDGESGNAISFFSLCILTVLFQVEQLIERRVITMTCSTSQSNSCSAHFGEKEENLPNVNVIRPFVTCQMSVGNDE